MLICTWMMAAFWAQEVTMPLADFEALWRRVHPSETQVDDLREAAIIERATVSMSIEADRVGLTTNYRIRVVHRKKAWLPLGSGRVVSINAHDADLYVERTGGTNQWVVDAEPGVYEVEADTVLPMTPLTSTARASAQIQWVPPVCGSIRVELKLPADLEVACDRGGILLDGDPPCLIVESGQPLTLHVGQRRQAEDQQPFSFRSQITASDSVARTRRQIRTQVNLTKQTGEWEPVIIQLPEGIELARIDAADEIGHTVEDQRLTVNVPAGFGRSCDLGMVFRLEPSANFTNLVPVVHGAIQSDWLVGTLIEGDGLLVLLNQGRTQRVNDPDELEKALRSSFSRFHSASSLTSDFGTALESQTATMAQWSVEWAESAELLALRVDTTHIHVTLGSSQQAFYQVWFEVYNNGAGRLQFALPEGAQWTNVTRDHQMIQAAGMGRFVSVPLRAAPETKQIVHCSAIVPLGLPRDGEFRLPLPSCSAPMAQIRLGLVAPPGLRLKASDDKPVMAFSPPSQAELIIPQGFQQKAYGWNAMAGELEPVTISVDEKRTREDWL